MREEFITQRPNNSFLHKTISYYYFYQAPINVDDKRFIYYPNFKNALTIYKNSGISYSQNHSTSKPDNRIDFSFIYSGVQRQFRTARIITPFNKIGIVFQELGINYFIKIPLCDISNDPINKSFNYFENDFVQLCESVYEEENIDNKVDLLDAFFVNKYFDFQEEMLEKAIAIILKSDEKTTVQELSNKCNISRKTLLRLFKKHLCCTPKDYIDIVQFRKALNDYSFSDRKISFTEIALENEYYDQAQFINHFRKLTGINPKIFFKNVKHLGGEDTFWTFQ